MYRYTLDYYHETIRKPMLEFKKKIYSQIHKRQDQPTIMKRLDVEIKAANDLYIEEASIDFDEDDDDNAGLA